MNPNATITDEQFKAYLKKVRDMVEGPYTEWQKEIEVTNSFPEKFYQSNIDNDIYRYSLPVEYGGWGLNEKEILQVQEEFSRGPSGMRMHMHYASDLNWRILDDFGTPEVKAKYMPLFQDKTISPTSLLLRRLVVLVLTCTPPQYGTKKRVFGYSMVRNGSSPTPTAHSSLT